MRKKERQITDETVLEKILNTAKVCRLAMVDGDKPYVVPLNFGYKEKTIYFHSAQEGRKIDIIKKNPQVCFEVDEMIKLKKASLACDWGAQYHSIIAEGRAQIVEGVEDKKKALEIIMSQYSNRTFEFPDEKIAITAVIAVHLEKISGKQA